MIVYGKNVLSQLQDDPSTILEVYVQKGLKNSQIQQVLKSLKGIPVHEVAKPYLDRMSSNGIHQGVAAKVKDLPNYTIEQLLKKVPEGKNGLFVALDELQDPHNIGAILRTCDAIGVDGVIMTKHRSAAITPAAVKASTGAAYTVPTASVTNMSQALQTMKDAGYWIVGTDFEDSRDYREGIYDVPVVLVIGNEGKGISKNVKKNCDYKVNLPMKGNVQSLNASVATGILLYEINRQREL
ncbi:MAG: 23S rRNA (guanosine(2251)-2'-O)-methyltransferase RlmB [Ileibacterium sp.]|nr:23S rRNA (guanosine(2251)-2'-O)-methyltransferase RlmB [Ileibacterium sp.]